MSDLLERLPMKGIGTTIPSAAIVEASAVRHVARGGFFSLEIVHSRHFILAGDAHPGIFVDWVRRHAQVT